MQEIQLLSEKLDVLLSKYESVKAENKRLKATVAEQSQSLEALNGQLASLEQQMMSFQTNKSQSGEEEKEAMRKQLDTVISEIDKILHTLND
ncbi:MAG: hypothetical protein EOP56_13825 [Sphingobacteriales bacterium]|nr:MAG: hypothetical protein EOP56_13825 [Sphingobacteriales bacterium]